MEKGKIEQQTIEAWQQQISQEYEVNPNLKARFKTVNDYLIFKMDEIFLEMKWKLMSQQQRDEYGDDKNAFIHYEVAAARGQVRVSGGAVIR